MVDMAMVAEVAEGQLAILEDPTGKIAWASRRLVETGVLGERVAGRTLRDVLGVDRARTIKRALGHNPAPVTIEGKVYQVESRDAVDGYTARTFTRVA